VSGAIGYTDAHVRQPAMFIMVLLCLGAAVAVGVTLWQDRLNLALLSVALLIAAGVLSRLVAPALVQKLVVEPNEASRERPYLEQHIDFTRRAYQLDNIDSVRLPYSSTA